MARKRSPEAALGELFRASPRPIYVLDDGRRIVYCNHACGDLLGVTPEQLVGKRCDYGVDPGANGLPATIGSLCPPPDVFASERAGSTEVALVHLSGTVVRRHAEYLPLSGDALRGAGVVAMLFEISAGGDRGTPADEAADLHRRLVRVRSQMLAEFPIEEFLGESPIARRVRDQVALAARGKSRVLVHGPAGSGRAHVARLIHRHIHAEPHGHAIPLCGPLMDAELVQATITTLVRQAATLGPDRRSEPDGAGQVAPTLLLLEVDELGEEAQAELAGFLALPGFELYCVATAREPLTTLADAGRFRVDLAHALSTLAIHLPPLAERREDVPLMSQYFVERCNARGDKQLSGFTPEALDALYEYPWPENADELVEVVEWACAAADGPWIGVRDLPDRIRFAQDAQARPRRKEEPIELLRVLEDVERELIARALRKTKGNKTRAAQWLGLTRARLLRRMEHFEMR